MVIHMAGLSDLLGSIQAWNKGLVGSIRVLSAFGFCTLGSYACRIGGVYSSDTLLYVILPKTQ